jgi:hypothetical protein
MPWLRHFALFLVFVAALFRPAVAGAFVSAPDAGSQARVGAFELVAATLVGPAIAATCGLHEGIGAAYDENASGYRFAAGGGETAATKAGRQAHKDWNAGEGFEKEVRLPSGKRADAVNWEARTVKELKPDTPRAVRRGEKQVEGYRRELEEMTGESWTGTVETYKRNP